MRAICRTALKIYTVFLLLLCTTSPSLSQELPTAKSLAAEMGFAWNIGNTMEVPKDPTAWGNPLPTQQLIDAVKAGGFKTVRIPCAWDSHADQASLTIDSKWLAQVQQVVDYCIKNGLYAIINSHWDGGWLESNITPAKKDEVNVKQKAYWTQIATHFRDYGQHLLFAGANEPGAQDPHGTPFGEDRMAVLMSYHQTFIDAVRATGGNNASRTLIIQGPKTNIELTYKLMKTMPADKVPNRLMAEVHFYPYQFTLMEKDADWGKVFYYWGKKNHSTTDTERNPTWGEESYVDSLFDLMKTLYTDKGIPVVLGEFGAIKRTNLTGETLKRHILSRRTYYHYVVSSALSRGIIPVAWDAGFKGNNTFTIFDRKTGAVYDLGLLNAMRTGGGLTPLPGDTALIKVVTGDNTLKILYSSKDSLWGQVDLGVKKENMNDVASITVRAYVNGETNYDSVGIAKFGWVSMSLVTMSQNWTWREGSLGKLTMNGWAEYTVPVSTDQNNKDALVPANPGKIDFFALQMYSRGFRGTIYVDWITFKSKGGGVDTVYSFNLNAPEEGKGNVEAVKMIATDSVESDTEWKIATTKYPFSTAVFNSAPVLPNKLHMHSANGRVAVSLVFPVAGVAYMKLQDISGRTVSSGFFHVKAGRNNLEFPTQYRGMMICTIRQGDHAVRGKVYCPQ